jgi:hypothetical protein
VKDAKRHWLFRLVTEPQEFAADILDGIRDALAAARPWLIGAALVLCVALLALVILRRLRAMRLVRDARQIRILPPPEVGAQSALTFWMGLHAILRPAWRRLVSGQPHLAWEVTADPDALTISVWVPRAVPPGLVERAIESAWPGARAEPDEESKLLPESEAAALTELVLAEPDHFPIGDAPDIDEPLRLALGTMTALQTGERAVIQVLARPATSAARFRLRRAARRLRRASQAAAPFWAVGQGPHPRAVRLPADPTVDPDVRAVLTKASSPLYECMVRVAVCSSRKEAARGKIHALAGSFAVFEGRNGFRRRRAPEAARRLEARSLTTRYLLSVPELAQVAALPTEPVAGMEWARARTLAPPRTLPHQGRTLGISDHPGVSRRVAISVADGMHHLHVVGETGTGKSTLIARMVLDDAAAKRAAVVIDPKGDLVTAIAARLPAGAEDRTCLLDPDDPEAAVGLNVLAGSNPDLVVDHIVSTFQRIYERSWGPRTDDIMRAACLTLTQVNGATLAEVPLLLTNYNWRRALKDRSELFANIGDVKTFWDWYEHLGEQHRAQHIAPLMNKLRAFLLRGPVRAIVGQDRPKLNIGKLIENRGLLLVRIPKGTLGEETSRILGAFVVARVWQAAMKRAELDESQRSPVSLYVDEMHNYLALPRSFEDMLAEARGYGLSLVLAHQHMGQLPRDMRTALGANARTKLAFTCSPEDATVLERHFRLYLSEHDLANLGTYQVACRPSIDGGHGPAFTFSTLPLGEADPRRTAVVRASSAKNFARPRREVQLAIHRRQGEISAGSYPGQALDQSVAQSDAQSVAQSVARSRTNHPAGGKAAGGNG